MIHERVKRMGAILATALCVAVPAAAQVPAGKIDPDGLTLESIKAAMPEYFARSERGSAAPEALPDVFGPGAVLRVGNVNMKVTNWGHCGNLFTTVSSDPGGQWPGASGVEYLSSIRLAVGAVNPRATDPNAVRRVSYLLEWRPETLDPEDKIYRAYDGIINGTRLGNDDGDQISIGGEREPLVDEDFLDGRDNDGDGRIDEDFGALGQEMYSCVMWDNTIQAVNTTFAEKHVPLGLECRQTAWAYSIRGFQDFNIIQYDIYNRSGHELDSVVVGFLVDPDAGPVRESSYFQDDLDLPHFPTGEFPMKIGSRQGEFPDVERAQTTHATVTDVHPDSALCPRLNIRVNGFSLADDNGDENQTQGIASFLLVNVEPLDPTGRFGNAPTRVGWKAYRSFTSTTPYAQGGNPTIDQQRFEFMTSNENIDQTTGFPSRELAGGEQKGDYIAWCSIGLWRNLPNDGKISITVAFAVKGPQLYRDAVRYLTDYDRVVAGTLGAADLFTRYPVLDNAIAAQLAFEGQHERREGFPVPDFHGRETPLRLPIGSPSQDFTEECPGREPRNLTLTDREYTWVDLDCSYCTGVWDEITGATFPEQGGLFHHTWNAEAPPPNPNINAAISYNFTDNPDRRVNPAGDRQVVLAWDNLPEITPDPKSGWLDFRGYRIWKVSDWSRPVGSPGPSETDWQLIGEFRKFDYEGPGGVPIERNYTVTPEGDTTCPMVFVPNFVYYDSTLGEQRQGKVIPICLDRGDLWDRQSGAIIKPDEAFPCIPLPDYPDSCQGVRACLLHRRPCENPANNGFVPQYPIGRYQYVDREVKNGFQYFYSVTAFDSVFDLSVTTELGGRRSAVEAEGIAPQISTGTGKSVWVVPNPYRGYQRVADRPSAWDLTPNASDPTGTHIDFMGLPSGEWTIRIFTVSGDLVAVINSGDPVNESIRPTVRQTISLPGGGSQERVLPGYNRQQDGPNDGQARWNLISRNGQDIVSGIYLFTVESNEGTQRGRFVVIR